VALAPFLMAVIPSIGVLFLFWLAIRAILEADRRERSAQARIEAAERLGNAGGGSAGPAPR
jgi:threonine/homoserine/homoserine lactone efflux protein